jgi:hypothetical protein
MLLAHLLPRGRLLVLPGEGHLMLMDRESGCHPAIREFLAAPAVEDAAVWKQAVEVDEHALEAGFAATGYQLPTWSIPVGLYRRRWLRGSG